MDYYISCSYTKYLGLLFFTQGSWINNRQQLQMSGEWDQVRYDQI